MSWSMSRRDDCPNEREDVLVVFEELYVLFYCVKVVPCGLPRRVLQPGRRHFVKTASTNRPVSGSISQRNPAKLPTIRGDRLWISV